MALQIIPSIDLRGGRVVRLRQGDYAQQLNYDVDPLQTAQSFSSAGATWMHIVDLDGAKEGQPAQTDLIRHILKQVPRLKVQVGGGVRSIEHVERLLGAGASRVVVGTKAVEDWPWFEQLMTVPALHHKLVLALDAKDGVIATRGWTASSGKLAIQVAQQVSQWPLAGILYTDVAKDGMMEGPNIEHTSRLAHAGRVPVIASGGVGNLQHVRQLLHIGVWGVVVGRSLYEGTLKLNEAIEIASGAGA